jgi:hypothetical protein
MSSLCEGFAQAYHKIPEAKDFKLEKSSIGCTPGAKLGKAPIVDVQLEVAAVDAWLCNYLQHLSHFSLS